MKGKSRPALAAWFAGTIAATSTSAYSALPCDTRCKVAILNTMLFQDPDPPPQLFFSAYPAGTTPGASNSVTVTARDAFQNAVTTYTGTIQFTSTDGAATLPPGYTFTAGDAGSHTFAGLILMTPGSQTIYATDSVNSLQASQTVTVCSANTCITWSWNGTSCVSGYASTSTLCNNGNPCTYNNHCDGSGNCIGTPVTCPATTTCTTGWACNGTSSCTPIYASTSTACSDSTPCTYAKACDGSGNCVGLPLPTGACCQTSDCPSGLSCAGNACAQSCPTGQQVCGSTCLAVGTQVCCPQDN
jgi:hypothetical protein